MKVFFPNRFGLTDTSDRHTNQGQDKAEAVGLITWMERLMGR